VGEKTHVRSKFVHILYIVKKYLFPTFWMFFDIFCFLVISAMSQTQSRFDKGVTSLQLSGSKRKRGEALNQLVELEKEDFEQAKKKIREKGFWRALFIQEKNQYYDCPYPSETVGKHPCHILAKKSGLLHEHLQRWHSNRLKVILSESHMNIQWSGHFNIKRVWLLN
jgi:hypothetical protein